MDLEFKYFEDAQDLARNIVYTASSISDFEVVGIYGHFEEIKYVLENLILCGCAISADVGIELYPESVNGYDKEFYLSIDNELEVIVEPIYDEEFHRYRGSEDVYSYLFNGCNSKILKEITTEKDKFLITYDVKDMYEEHKHNCDGHCECHCNSDKKCELSNEEIEELLSEMKDSFHKINALIDEFSSFDDFFRF